jgi:hypothetical protein
MITSLISGLPRRETWRHGPVCESEPLLKTDVDRRQALVHIPTTALALDAG